MNLLTRLRELSEKQVWSDDEFILAMRVFPRLLDVVEAAKEVIDDYASPYGLFELDKALQALERET